MPERGCGAAPPTRLVAGLLTGLLLLAGCASTPPASGATSPASGTPPVAAASPAAAPSPGAGGMAVGRRLIVDTDLDADDLRALAYVAARPDVDLLAVTVAGTGVVHCPVGAAIARAVLDRVGRARVPVACGRSTPLAGSAAFPEAWRSRADAATGLDLSTAAAVSSSGSTGAVDLITRLLVGATAPVDLIVIGPATNLAEALAPHSGLARRVGSVTLMGGALRVPGNVAGAGIADANMTAEWNVFADPAAWQAVLDAGLRTTIVPLDATNDVPVTPAAFLSIAANRDAPPARLVFDLFDADPGLLAGEQSFWDPLAAVAAFDPSVVTTRTTAVRVLQTPGAELGRLVEDPSGAPVTIATAADAAAFQSAFVSTLNGGSPVRPIPDPSIRLAVTFDGTTCRGDVPATIPTGFVSIGLDNRTGADAGAGLFLLADGVSVGDVLTAAATDPGRLPTLGRIVASVGAGASSTARDVGIATRAGTAFVGCLSWGDPPRLVPSSMLSIGP